MSADLLKRAKALFGREPAAPAAAAPRKATHKFHAVSIVRGALACDAARALGERRFLSSEAPSLPLKGCDQSQCDCRYEHHEDRRKAGRRAHDLGVSIDGYEGGEQRQKSKRGRRQGEK